jgi:3,4-dihydroxy 2-butanone 4-phosphate synthase / GTP cyclohydrolase II
MRDDGSIARLDDLIGFARLHNLKIGTIRDLIAYRRKHDRMVEKRAELAFTSRWGGEWKACTFYNKATGDETMALVKGFIDPDQPTLVRMHTLSIFADIYGEEGERGDILHRSMEIIGEHGSGVIVVINRPMQRLMSKAIEVKTKVRAGDPSAIEELRDYGVGAQVLAELGVHDMILLTNTHHSLVALEGYGLSIVGERPID